MSQRHLPVRPDLEQLRHQAKDFLRDLRAGDPAARAEFERHHPRGAALVRGGTSARVRLADAQLALARSYGVASWPRLVLACRMTDALWRGDEDGVLELVGAHPELLHEDARGVAGNWGPPLSYAANLGREAIVRALHQRGARDLEHAFERACLQGQLGTARALHALGARPRRGSLMGPCESLNPAGLGFLLECGAKIADEHGDPLAPLACVLQTYARDPAGKHGCLEILSRGGVPMPDTPALALHRGSLERLWHLLQRDPALLRRTFTLREFYPREAGCAEDLSLALHGTPLEGGTLLHAAVDAGDLEAARWLLEEGAPVDARAALDERGFGGHTPLFGCVVSQPHRVGLSDGGAMVRLLLDRGADPNARASLRKRLRFVADETEHEYREVTPLSWGQRFHDQDWVDRQAMTQIAERGGRA